MRILHVLSQRPEMTGSGVSTLAMLRCAGDAGHSNALVAGVPAAFAVPVQLGGGTPQAQEEHCLCSFSSFVRFGRDLPFAVTGMSDVMPYESSRWAQLDDSQLDAYEACFGECLRNAVQAFRPQIIHSNHLWVVTALARRLFPQIPVVASCHGSDLRQFRSVPRVARRVLAACRMVDGVFALSQAQKRDIEMLYGIDSRRISVVAAGYDRQVFGCGRPWRRNTAGGPLRVLYAGKLSRAKGVPWLLRACARLLGCGHDMVLDICGGGTGSDYEECVALARGLGERAVLHGNVSQNRLAELMRAAHVFVLPSFFEGLPLVLLEALACGCRLVATRLEGVEEVFAGLPSEAVTLVDLPRLHDVDRPFAEDERRFEHNLHAALKNCLQTMNAPVAGGVSPAVDALLDGYSWEAVFGRVDAVYRRIVSDCC
ncbi:glycosyltransferase family 4 protein [Oleidesulfovibrio alaskensis]